MVWPSLKHVEDTALGPFDQQCDHLQLQIKISRWLTMKRIIVESVMSGRSVETKGK